ncbi:MAG TPA: Gfo/Idh/MocA family oxidoreductase [Sphaerochaeta sp.]|nr:Gfo/Idh/MocA family oxidoreductase [Sphaerochaeta sp.]
MKTALIGLGYIGKVHLIALRTIPEVQEIVLVDSNIEECKKVAKIFGISRVYKDYREILENKTIDVVHNCTPNNLHYEINLACLEADKHVLSEKPLCLDAENARSLITLAEKKKLHTAVNYCYRYYPSVQEAASKIESGALGKIHTVKGAFLQDWLSTPRDYSWRLDPSFSGKSNTVADIGTHWTDLFEFLTGSKIISVCSDLATIYPLRKKKLEGQDTFTKSNDSNGLSTDISIELEDYASILFKANNGISGVFTVCQACPGEKVSLNISIFGEDGSLHWDHRNPTIHTIGMRDGFQIKHIDDPLQQDECTAGFTTLPAGHPMGYHDALSNLFKEFYHQIKTGLPLYKGVPTFQEGLNAINLVDAIIASAKEKRWVTVGD